MVKLLDRTHPATGAPPAYALAVLVQSDVAEHTNPEAVALIAAISLAVYEYHDAKFAPVAPSVPAP